jgi:hypothetical protein
LIILAIFELGKDALDGHDLFVTRVEERLAVLELVILRLRQNVDLLADGGGMF